MYSAVWNCVFLIATRSGTWLLYIYIQHSSSTMCDFLDFGLTFFSIMCIQVVTWLPQRLKPEFFWKAQLKSMFFEKFSSLRWPLRSRSIRKKFQKTLILSFQKMFILAFEANSALSRENETKIVKITHSQNRKFESATSLKINFQISDFDT